MLEDNTLDWLLWARRLDLIVVKKENEVYQTSCRCAAVKLREGEKLADDCYNIQL